MTPQNLNRDCSVGGNCCQFLENEHPVSIRIFAEALDTVFMYIFLAMLNDNG